MTELVKTNGIIIRKFDYSNTSVIFHLLSADNGIVHILAKGAKNKQNSFSGKLEFFQEIYCTYFKTGKSDLFILKECGFIKDFPLIKNDITLFYISSYMLEIISVFPWEEQDASKIFNLISAVFTFFEKTEDDKYILLLSFYILKILYLLGYTPNLETCCNTNKHFSKIVSPAVYPDIGFSNIIQSDRKNPRIERETIVILKKLNQITKLKQINEFIDCSGYKLQFMDCLSFFIENISGKTLKSYKTMIKFI